MIEQNYNTTPGELPLEQNLEKFAIPHFPEKFTREEKQYLKPFFTNDNGPIFAAHNLPEEVIGALSSRYSRATKGVRRIFIDEYINPVLYPEQQKDWGDLSPREKTKSFKTRDNFKSWIEHMNETGGIDEVVNVQRGRKFFDKWLAEYGDDSIAELGGVHLFLEGISNVAANEIEAKRIGISPLEKSSRYVSFREKRKDGEYQYIIPGEIKGTDDEVIFKDAMDRLFDVYNQIAEPYKEYIKQLYPMGQDETSKSFEGSRGAKRFDDIRDLLPFATQTSVALHGNGRAFEDLISRMAAHPLGENRWIAQQMEKELEKIVPSFVARPKTQRGAEVQLYRTNLDVVKERWAKNLKEKKQSKFPRWVELVDYTPNATIEVLAAFLFRKSDLPLSEIKKQVKKWGNKKIKKAFQQIYAERNFGKDDPDRAEVRFRKVPRAFEKAEYTFDLWGRGGDFRDLHRHRQATQDRQRFTSRWGFDLEKEMLNSPFKQEVIDALTESGNVFRKLAEKNPDIAQYAVAYGYIQHWFMKITAREIVWMSELRTGPQGREHYRQIVQDFTKKAMKKDPILFLGIKTDWGSYALSRRESEKKKEQKFNSLGA